MIITNRSCQYPHRRRLVVQEIVVDNNNNIEELIVDEFKNEGVVYEEGTKLTAKNLELILNKYHVENLYGEWIQSEIECDRYFLIETAIPLELILTNEAEDYVNRLYDFITDFYERFNETVDRGEILEACKQK